MKKVLLFNVYDNFETTEKFLMSEECNYSLNVDLDDDDFLVESYDVYGFAGDIQLTDVCTNQQFVEAVQNFKPYSDECFIYNLSRESKQNGKRRELVPYEDFIIYELPYNATDFEVVNHFNRQYRHLYQEVLYVVDGKIHRYAFGGE